MDSTKAWWRFTATLVLVIMQILKTAADITVSVNPQSKQVPLYKDVFMNCEFRFSPKPNQMSPSSEETGAEIEWLKMEPGTPIFQKVVEYSGAGYLARSVKVRVYSYNQEKQTKASSLEIRRISEGDAGTYKCIIRGGRTSGGAETNDAQLQIVPGISVSPSVVSIELDRSFMISCNVTTTQGFNYLRGRTDQSTITWTYANNRQIDPDDPIAMQRLMEIARDVSYYPDLNFDVSQSGSVLSVRRATVDHAGYYWCTYEAQSGTFQGRVHERAIVRYGPTYKLNEFNRTNTTRTIKAFVGSTVDIYCNIISLPFAQVEWFRNNRPIGHDQMRHENPLDGRRYYYYLIRDKDGYPSVLRMNNLQYRDRDEYVCNVTAYGIRASWSTLLKVKDKYSAFFPLGVIVTQMVLIFSLIFGAEKVYVRKDHHHHHHHAHTHTSHLNLEQDMNGTIRSRAMTLPNSPTITNNPNMFSSHPVSGVPQGSNLLTGTGGVSSRHHPHQMGGTNAMQSPPLILQQQTSYAFDTLSSINRSSTLPTHARTPQPTRGGVI